MRRIELVKKMLTSCVDKVKCARCFEETLDLKELGGGLSSLAAQDSRRARTKKWLGAKDVAHQACEKNADVVR